MDALIYNHRLWVEETDSVLLQNSLKGILTKLEYGVLDFCEHYFSPQGYTCLWLLSESHLAVHTFPEHGRSYIELSGCNGEKTKNFIPLIEKSFTIIDEGSEK